MSTQRSLTQEIARFVVETKFEDIPKIVVHEAKRTLLDSVGCALAGIVTDKGKISIKLARKLGGPPESSIIGVGDKVSCCNAAFANGELINALDYDAVHFPPGHVSPFVIPPPLAVAESIKAPGKDLLLAIILGHEISLRISSALTAFAAFIPEEAEKGAVKSAPVLGYGQCIFGGTAGAGKILKLDHKKMTHALGIAGHICSVPSIRKWEETVPLAMTKYESAGWLSTGGVTAALLAEMGYVGDTTILDGEYGFWRFFGSERWDPDVITEKIGEKWLFSETKYKFYPCCHCMHSSLDCFNSIIDKNNLMPEEIESVKVFCHPLIERPIWRNNELASNIDAQFSVAYVFAAAAHRVKLEDWQDLDIIKNKKILEFMKKVNYQAHPKFAEGRPRSSFGMVEVMAKGEIFREERKYAKGTSFTDFKATDEELIEKFKRNASRILTRDKIDEAIKSLLDLEKLENIAELTMQITL